MWHKTHGSRNTDCLIISCTVWHVLKLLFEFLEMVALELDDCCTFSFSSLGTKFTTSQCRERERWQCLYLLVCCVRSLQGTGHRGRASRSCSRHTVACSPRRSSLTGWASSGTPETVSPAARSPYSTGRYLKVIVLRKALGLVWTKGVAIPDPCWVILNWWRVK